MNKTLLDKYKVSITRQKDGSYLAVCGDVPGVYAEGKTYLDAVLNIEDVLRISLELLGASKKDQKTSKSFTFELPNPFGVSFTS